MIPFNKPFIVERSLSYVKDSILSGKHSGDGPYTKKVTDYFNSFYKNSKCLLTTSCTDALEMISILLDIKEGDEIIAPSYTFVSTVLPFVMKGAKIKFVDVEKTSPHISIKTIIDSITIRTKAIITVNYGGQGFDLLKLASLAKSYGIVLIEDNAQGIYGSYDGYNLGSFGDFSTLSFHETKNITCGEGGLLVINNPKYFERAEIIREKGTNRSSFFRGEINKYGWVDVGSSFLPSDILAAYLLGQLECSAFILKGRMAVWNKYFDSFNDLKINQSIGHSNGHIYYLTMESLKQRTDYIQFMKDNGIYCAFHYQPLHTSDYFKNQDNLNLINTDMFGECLVRLPLFPELKDSEQDLIINKTKEFLGV